MVSISVPENVGMRKESWRDRGKKDEPVSGTSERGARALYHDDGPRDFGPRIAYTVIWTSDTSRARSGREGEKCRPLDHMWQIPFTHPALFVT